MLECLVEHLLSSAYSLPPFYVLMTSTLNICLAYLGVFDVYTLLSRLPGVNIYFKSLPQINSTIGAYQFSYNRLFSYQIISRNLNNIIMITLESIDYFIQYNMIFALILRRKEYYVSFSSCAAHKVGR